MCHQQASEDTASIVPKKLMLNDLESKICGWMGLMILQLLILVILDQVFIWQHYKQCVRFGFTLFLSLEDRFFPSKYHLRRRIVSFFLQQSLSNTTAHSALYQLHESVFSEMTSNFVCLSFWLSNLRGNKKACVVPSPNKFR